jgi:hypothetical protein
VSDCERRLGGMSALKHGFFRVGFMLCDRCVLNTRCERFRPGSECVMEKEAYDWLTGELIEQYGLEGLADEIYVWRAAMYLIRIARAETYESAVGVTEKSALWGAYISRLDNTLRGLLNDLAVTRLKRKRLQKGEELMVSVENLLERLAGRATEAEGRIVKKLRLMREPRKVMRMRVFRIRPTTVYEKILAEWREEKRCLKEHGEGDCGEGNS